MYKHNYEKLTIPEAQSIIDGTFVQDTTSIPGECITKFQVLSMCRNADKTMLNPVPEDGGSNELICWFEVRNNRIDPTSIRVEDYTILTEQNILAILKEDTNEDNQYTN